MNNKLDAIKNSLISFVLGDMIGTPIQFTLRKNLQELFKDTSTSVKELILKSNSFVPFGSWSDDSSMTLCTMESIAEKKCIDLDNIVEKFIKWLYENYMTPNGRTFDVGDTTIRSLNKYRYTNKVIPQGLNTINSNGNGSLMRILPVSIYCYFKNLSDKEIFEIIKDVSALTHAHPISILGCYIYTLIVFDILDGKTKDEIIDNLENIYNDTAIPYEYKEWLNEYKKVLDGSIINETADNINSSGYVKNTLEVALWGFYNTESVEDCIFKIIELGEDTDTNGAVGASLSGLYYGLRGNPAPKYWVDKIIKKEMILEIIEKFTETFEMV